MFENLPERIEVNPAVMLGKPVVRGTRIPIYLILEKLEAGASFEDLLDSHPRLVREDIQAVIDYSKRYTNGEK